MNYVKAIIGIKSVLKLWRMRNLTLEGKIIIFKNVALSKITYMALLIIFPKYIISEIEHFYGNIVFQKLNKILKMDYKDGGLKDFDIFFKIASLQCSQVKSLYSESFHEWKIIQL